MIHALCDALLGAAALGDIGLHFPNTSSDFKGIDSKILLQRTVLLLEKRGFSVVNIDCTLLLQQPKIKPYVEQMRTVLAQTIGIDVVNVSVKATTTEKLGFVGEEQGVAAHAVVLVEKIQ